MGTGVAGSIAVRNARPGAPASMFMRLINEVKGAQAIAILPKATDFSEAFQLVLQGPDLAQLEGVGRQVAVEGRLFGRFKGDS